MLSMAGHGYPKISRQLSGVNRMGKEKKTNRENKKQPLMTPKEKKAAKKLKKEEKGLFANNI